MQLIDEPPLLHALCERIERAGRVGLDTEFHGERFYAPRLMVAQIAFEDGVALVDALRIGDLSPLARALASVEVIGHALQSDLRILADRFDLLPERAFDTQLAAAFCGYGMAISLGDLVQNVLEVRLRKAHTVSDWSSRPLSEQQLIYLVDDVKYLHPLAQRLRERLERSDRLGWFEEESRRLVDLQAYRGDPERLYLRISGASRMNRRQLAVLRELAQLRDALARERDVPVKYIVPDDALASLVHLQPASVAELAQLRRVDGGMRKSYGEELVAAVRRGLAVPEELLPQRPQRPAGAEREGIASLLNVLVQQIASDRGLPAALLAPRAALERVARELPTDRRGLARLLSEDGEPDEHWRAQVIAAPLWALLQGEVALGIAGAATGSPRVEARSIRGEPDR